MVFLGKPEGRRPLGRPRRRWVDNIRMDLQEVGCGYMDWSGLAQDRDRWRTLLSAVMNLRVSWNAGNFLTSCKPVSFSRRTLHHEVSKFILKENQIFVGSFRTKYSIHSSAVHSLASTGTEISYTTLMLLRRNTERKTRKHFSVSPDRSIRKHQLWCKKSVMDDKTQRN